MSGLTQMVSRALGGRGAATGRAGRGAMGSPARSRRPGGRARSGMGGRSQDEAIGRGVRALLRRAR